MIEQKIDILRQLGIERILKDQDKRALFHEVALSVFGHNCLNCDDKIREQYSLLLTKKTIMKSKYKLKPEFNLISRNTPDWKEDISNANMTDKKAEMLLNVTLKYIFQFEEAPNLEELRVAAEKGVRTLNAALKKDPPPNTYFDELTALKGIGAATAEKIIEAYPTIDLLLDALITDEEMLFLGKQENKIKEILKVI